MAIAVKLKRKKSKNDVVAVPRPVKELNAQQKESEYLERGQARCCSFSVNGLQDARFVVAASSQGLTVSKNANAFEVIKWNTI